MVKPPRGVSDEQRQEDERRRKRELDDVRSILGTDQGYRFVCRLLAYCKTFESIWSASAEIHRNAGRQDIGHYLFAEVVQASPETLGKMMLEIKREQMELENLKASEMKEKK